MTQPKLSIRQVEIVEAVARHRSVSKAANELHVTQSALSHALGVIEDGLGVKLFTRAQSGVEPTAYVEPFIARARTLRSVIADTTRELKSKAKQPVRSLTIQCGFRAGVLWVTPALAKVAAQIPELHINISYNVQSIQSDVERGITDIGLASPQQYNATDAFLVEPLGQLTNQLYASPHHPLAKLDVVTLDDLRNYPMVGNLIILPHADIFEGNPGRLGTYDPVTRTMRCAISINTIGGVIDVLRQSDGVACLPPPLVSEAVNAGHIVQLNDELVTHLPIDVNIIARRSALERREVQLFINALKEVEQYRHSNSDV
ncbi:MAG: LysR family transcriptional regulator [Alphaproteobacteria bacterium]